MAFDTFGREILTTFDNGGVKASEKLIVNGTAEIEGQLELDGTLDVQGDANFNGKLTVGDDLIVNGTGIFNDDILVTGLVDITGDLFVNGQEILPGGDNPSEIVYVVDVNDLPDAVAGVRTLTTGILYWVLNPIDLGTDYIEMTDGCYIRGFSAQHAQVTSANTTATIKMTLGAFETVTIDLGLRVVNTSATGKAIHQTGGILFVKPLCCPRWGPFKHIKCSYLFGSCYCSGTV